MALSESCMDSGFPAKVFWEIRVGGSCMGLKPVSEIMGLNNNSHHPEEEEQRARAVQQLVQGHISWTKPGLAHLSKVCCCWNVSHRSSPLNRAQWTQCRSLWRWAREWASVRTNSVKLATVLCYLLPHNRIQGWCFFFKLLLWMRRHRAQAMGPEESCFSLFEPRFLGVTECQ